MKLRKLWHTIPLMVVAALVGSLLSASDAGAAGPRYRIKSWYLGSAYCLDGNSGNGGGVYTWSCVNASNQYWYFDFIGSEGYARIRNAKTGLCLHVQGGVAYPALIVNGACNDTWDAWWKGIDRMQDGADYYRLTPYYMRGSYCLNVPSSGNGVGTMNDACFHNEPHPYSNYWTWSPA
ncbi:RICIN domain-containing protein [Amycolatopsis sp. NPDC004169]|uniref:RICIN domain-containing protein n=1 Tax=Amycolatopsis sp. NPDC004169 TaxID=3154453 RepID=UPI0033A5DF1D